MIFHSVRHFHLLKCPTLCPGMKMEHHPLPLTHLVLRVTLKCKLPRGWRTTCAHCAAQRNKTSTGFGLSDTHTHSRQRSCWPPEPFTFQLNILMNICTRSLSLHPLHGSVCSPGPRGSPHSGPMTSIRTACQRLTKRLCTLK